MIRPPRKKTEHLVTSRLLMISYGISGFFGCGAAFMAYFSTMYFYGFKYQGLVGMSSYTAFQMPMEGDTFDEDLPNLGNSNLGSKDFYNLIAGPQKTLRNL